MKPWLRGDLSGVDPRREMGLLRDAVLGAAHRGEDLRAFWSALGALDPVACAELAAGPRAVSHRQAVEGSLAAAEALERVLAPSGLYPRLIDLAPEAAPVVLDAAARRHPAAEWVVRLSRRHDPVPGRVHLRAAAGTPAFAAVCAFYAQAGLPEALIAAAAETDGLEPVLALHRAGDLESSAAAAGRALDARPGTPLLPWLAALHGPDLGPLLLRVAAHLSGRAGRDALRAACADFPEVVARLAAPPSSG